MSRLQQGLRALPPGALAGIRRGVEKESLRALGTGALALTPHPSALGSALTHPNVTTDFSESQIELVTGVHGDVQSCVDELTRIHQFVYRAIGTEMLWVASMPCVLPVDETIPLGRYGSSNVGRAKSVYRMGLGHRYGRRMQTISGIHYNWSLPGITNDGYFSLIRNFRRHSFLLLTLFGASPALCSSFVAGRPHELQTLQDHTLYMPHGTSLRMGRLGYQSDAQSTLAVSYNSLEGYGASLEEALTRPYPAYEAVGVRNPAGEYNQLATSLLQIENEFYGTIRPKRVIFPGERPLHALRERGVEYVEVRCMDLDPFVPAGIQAQTMRFIDVFLLHCLLSDSPPDSPDEIAEIGRNQHRTAARGREPGLTLERGGKDVQLVDWAAQLIDECGPLADAMDEALGGTDHRDAVAAARTALDRPDSLPSARVLEAMVRDHGGSFIGFARARSQVVRAEMGTLAFSHAHAAHLAELARKSVTDQAAIEAADTMPFEEYRKAYLATERLGVRRPVTA